ncbi:MULTISPECIES: DNA polymerase III subunit alpha [Bacillus]|uniref:DNA polymerase III subunit alpha n=1 Tax=Bacillus TaxID=1386 RepID=UPI000E2F2416|nr:MULTISPECIES: DNA polymerase III subunit alpha [Bacillus]MBS4748274.1 DNA polymerase III subunit alpha [Bacillus altitudinis]MCY7497059.1 DNA polymerase III subunit alpha [Bacillus altitudinis]MCY7534366.1 DNA polymerase III subunit alpha [Bacillus altitudinis]MCY7546880.1 DNA polymerase III subunit alpha [Bacillus altitudinis]MCY7554832.1 DNA polymerase III subunit alpha [Bacillus altitudinis]
MSYVHLQVHSGYSLLSSAAKVKELVLKAKELGYQALALTDDHVMYGTVEFYKECKTHGIKPIIGLTASVFIDEQETEAYPLILLAKNNEGYQNLIKISSVLKSKSKTGLKEKWLKAYHHGLIAITPGVSGYIETLLQHDQLDEARDAASHLKDLFGEEHVYLAVQPFQQDEELSHKLRELSKRANIPLVATGDVHYIHQEDKTAYTCLKAIKASQQLSEIEEDQGDKHFRSIEEMMKWYGDDPELLARTVEIANRCEVDLNLGQTKLPTYPTPDQSTADQFLRRVCQEGMKRRQIASNDTYIKRLEYELSIIQKMNFSDYFLIVWDFMKYAHDHGIVTGPGRGSAAGSLVAYVLFITDVDPIRHGLLFERFLNPERISMPDIDIDFPDTRRDEIISYVKDKYGDMHVAQIVTFGTLAAKAALRDVGRVMGIDSKAADRLAKLIPSKPGTTLKEAVTVSSELKTLLQQSEELQRVFQTALKVEGLPRHTSTHAAGVVLSEEPLTQVVPIQEGHDGVYLTQYAMNYLEDLGLLKMDFLGLRNLTLIESIKNQIERQENVHINFSDISYEDQKTFDLLSAGDTTGIFQLESQGMRQVLRRLKPSSLEDIVAVNALYRPGPMENIPLFIDRKHGRVKVSYPHPDLYDILKDTYGVIVYQEQIMLIAAKMAGFKLGEADLLRRAVSKKDKKVLDEERSHFVEGCLKKEYPVNIANDVYDLIVKFANYGFNRSHAVAYSMIGFQLAYLKAHYPLYFMCGLLTSVIGNEDKVAQYFYEAKEKGISVLKPSINKSEFPFTVEKGEIRYSLRAIKNVGVSAVKDIYRARQEKPFEDLFDFCARVSTKSVNRKTIEALIFSGAMDELHPNRASLLASIDIALDHVSFLTPEDQLDFLGDTTFPLELKYAEIEEMPLVDLLQFEKEALGLYLSNHPVQAYRDRLRENGAVEIIRLSSYIKRKISMGGLLTKVKSIRTKNGQSMAFVTFGDETGEMEGVVFPEQFRKLSPLLEEGAMLYVEGRIDVRNESSQIIVQEAVLLEEMGSKRKESVYIRVKEENHTQELLEQVKRVISMHSGEADVYLYYEKQKKTMRLPDAYKVHADHAVIFQLKELLGEQNVVIK